MTPPDAQASPASPATLAAPAVGAWRLAIGLSILLGGAMASAHGAWELWRHTHPLVAQAWASGWIAAAATALGTLPVWMTRGVSQRTRDSLMGFGAGVMLAASMFSLITPALDAAQAKGLGDWGSAALVSASILLGAGALMLVEQSLPAVPLARPRVWLFVAAVALHNLPEGLAIGVAHGGADPAAAQALSTGIAIQDLPEGFVIASALVATGHGRLFSVAVGAASGLVEPIGAVAAASMMAWSSWMLPWGLALAAGAMLFVISHDIIPDANQPTRGMTPTAALLLGFVVMMSLDTALG
jgi:ZIP family zinc transporter